MEIGGTADGGYRGILMPLAAFCNSRLRIPDWLQRYRGRTAPDTMRRNMIAILEAAHAGLLRKDQWLSNLLAGLTVGVVALPLAMAFAIASGARPEQGIYTAVVAGLATALFGGTRMQISGPTGAFVAVLATITAEHGIGGLAVATFLAGIMLVAMGVTRMGSVLKYIPDPVIVGFTSGIGLIIFVGQLKYFFGVHPAALGTHFHQQLQALAGELSHVHLVTAALGLASLLVVLVGTRYLKRIPSPLVALVLATLAQALFSFDGVATIGTAYGGIPRSLPHLGLPVDSFTEIVKLIGPAFTIALLGAIESLLSATIADGMAGTRHDSNQELIGQGIANLLAPLCGGFAATGASARTATNIRNGATVPLAGVVHSLFLVVVIVALAPLASYVPLAALAAILFVVAWNMSDVRRFVKMATTAPRPDVAILLITFMLTVFTDLVVAVGISVVLASLVFMRRMAQAVSVDQQPHEELAEESLGRWALPAGTVVYQIDGPFFFAAAEKLDGALRHSQTRPRALVLRLGRMPFIDSTGVAALEEMIDDFSRHHTRVVLCEVPPNVAEKLGRAGILDRLGAGSVFATLADFARAAS